jgi:hypothetical protein
MCWLKCSVGSSGTGVGLIICCESGILQRPVCMSRFPCSSVVPFLLMVTWWVLKVAVHPASHSLPIDMSELCVRSGKMCASLAALGNCGRSRVQAVLLDRRNAPFGNPTVMVVLVVLSVLCGSFVLR